MRNQNVLKLLFTDAKTPKFAVENEVTGESEHMIVLGLAERGPGTINMLVGKDLKDNFG